ncbi:MAG: hypothetical protein R6V08_09930 [Desulfuromonadales bacterium]
MLLTTLLMTGCAGHGNVQESCYRLASQGQLDESLERLEESRLARQGRDRLLYLMEKGTLLHLQGAYRQSNEVLEEADRLFEDLFTRSVTAETFSFATNDTVIPYAGADYESVYLNYYKILNYLALDEISDAAVEARRIDEKLNWFSDRYGDSHSFQEDAFLRLLSGFVYEALGDANNALVAYRKSLEAFQTNQERYGVAVPQFLWRRLAVSARRTGLLEPAREYGEMAGDGDKGNDSGDGIVVVIVNNGAIPRKVPVRAVFPSGHGFPVALAVPDFAPSSFGADEIRVSLEGKRWRDAEKTEDLAAVARRSLEDRKGRVLGKAIARVVTKQLAARQARKEAGPLAGFIAQVFALTTEQADLRSWTTLPREIRTAVLPVPPGEHRLILQLGAQQKTQEVTVPPEGVAFVFTRIF